MATMNQMQESPVRERLLDWKASTLTTQQYSFSILSVHPKRIEKCIGHNFDLAIFKLKIVVSTCVHVEETPINTYGLGTKYEV